MKCQPRALENSNIHVPGRSLVGLLLTYGLATRHACYAPATHPLLAVDLHVWFSQDEEVFYSTSQVTR